MENKTLKRISIFFEGAILATVISFLFNSLAETAPLCQVEFTSDVILNLNGLSTTTYIASSSQATFLEINQADGILQVNGICDGGFFLLKTTDHKILKLTPSGCSVDLLFSSANEQGGYVNQWKATTTCNVSFLVGVPKINTNYIVKFEGTPIPGSPFNSGTQGEISFTYNGSGTYIIEEVQFTPPSVETLSAINITNDRATLRGKLTDLGNAQEVNVWFEWGTSSGVYNFSSPPETKTSVGIFSKTISDLIPNTKYYFRAVAQNEAGTTYGQEQSFVTIEGFFITIIQGEKTRIIEIDREGRIIIKK